MKLPTDETTYFFVDEAGDSTFYNRYGENIVGKEGCSPILLLGFIKTHDPKNLRKKLLALQQEIIQDQYFQGVPSMKKTAVAFHAKDDIPEIREKVYKLLVSLDFSAEFIIARKKEVIFKKQHKGKENLFYDSLIIQLFKNKLHTSNRSIIYFAKRGSRDRQAPLEEAIYVAKQTFEEKWGASINTDIEILAQVPSDEPCLQIADYMNWAVQRAFIRREDRYLQFVQEKISFIADIYDFDIYPKNFYSRKNVFSLDKISPL